MASSSNHHRPDENDIEPPPPSSPAEQEEVSVQQSEKRSTRLVTQIPTTPSAAVPVQSRPRFVPLAKRDGERSAATVPDEVYTRLMNSHDGLLSENGYLFSESERRDGEYKSLASELERVSFHNRALRRENRDLQGEIASLSDTCKSLHMKEMTLSSQNQELGQILKRYRRVEVAGSRRRLSQELDDTDDANEAHLEEHGGVIYQKENVQLKHSNALLSKDISQLRLQLQDVLRYLTDLRTRHGNFSTELWHMLSKHKLQQHLYRSFLIEHGDQANEDGSQSRSPELKRVCSLIMADAATMTSEQEQSDREAQPLHELFPPAPVYDPTRLMTPEVRFQTPEPSFAVSVQFPVHGDQNGRSGRASTSGYRSSCPTMLTSVWDTPEKKHLVPSSTDGSPPVPPRATHESTRERDPESKYAEAAVQTADHTAILKHGTRGTWRDVFVQPETRIDIDVWARGIQESLNYSASSVSTNKHSPERDGSIDSPANIRGPWQIPEPNVMPELLQSFPDGHPWKAPKNASTHTSTVLGVRSTVPGSSKSQECKTPPRKPSRRWTLPEPQPHHILKPDSSSSTTAITSDRTPATPSDISLHSPHSHISTIMNERDSQLIQDIEALLGVDRNEETLGNQAMSSQLTSIAGWLTELSSSESFDTSTNSDFSLNKGMQHERRQTLRQLEGGDGPSTDVPVWQIGPEHLRGWNAFRRQFKAVGAGPSRSASTTENMTSRPSLSSLSRTDAMPILDQHNAYDVVEEAAGKAVQPKLISATASTGQEERLLSLGTDSFDSHPSANSSMTHCSHSPDISTMHDHSIENASQGWDPHKDNTKRHPTEFQAFAALDMGFWSELVRLIANLVTIGQQVVDDVKNLITTSMRQVELSATATPPVRRVSGVARPWIFMHETTTPLRNLDRGNFSIKKPGQQRLIGLLLTFGWWTSMAWLLLATLVLQKEWRGHNVVRAQKDVRIWQSEGWVLRPAVTFQRAVVHTLDPYALPLTDFT